MTYTGHTSGPSSGSASTSFGGSLDTREDRAGSWGSNAGRPYARQGDHAAGGGGSSSYRDVSPHAPSHRTASPGIHTVMQEASQYLRGGHPAQASGGNTGGQYQQRLASPHPYDLHRAPSPSRAPPTSAQQQQQQQQQAQHGQPSPVWGQMPPPGLPSGGQARRPQNGPYAAPGSSAPQGSSSSGSEPFLGYNDLFLGGGNRDLTEEDLRQVKMAESMARLDLHGDSELYPASRAADSYPFPQGGSQASGMPNLPGVPSSGSLSPRSLLQYHHQQLQAQHALALQAAQQAGPAAGHAQPNMLQEEITTVFIVGFPDDMTEREFANMFLFAKGFEASTLKVPAGGVHSGGSQREGSISGPSGPYNSVQLQAMAPPGGAVGGGSQGWDDQTLSLALARAGAGNSDALASLAGAGNQGVGGQQGKIKQIIGFAKFRTRADALEARDALNGRKIDAERGCVLKTEMAKKNLHTKQRPALVPGMKSEANTNLPSGFSTGMLSPMERDQAGTFFNNAARQGQAPPASQQAALERLAGLPPGMQTQEILLRHVELLRAQQAAQQGGPSQQHDPSKQGQDKWATMGPLDFYNDERSSLQPQSSSRSEWGSVGSPPSASGSMRPLGPGAQQQEPPRGGPRGPQDFGQGESGQETYQNHNSNSYSHQGNGRPDPQRLAASGLDLGSPERAQTYASAAASAAAKTAASSASASGPPTAWNDPKKPQHLEPGRPDDSPSPQGSELPSPTHRAFVGDQNPPGTTLFVGNLPASLTAASSAQLEEKLRMLFSARPGFRQMSYKLKAHGPMCFVEFDSTQYASQSLTEVNGDTLGGLLRGQGIRLSYSKNALFRNGNTQHTSKPHALSNSSAGPGTFPRRMPHENLLDFDKLNSLEESAFAKGFQGGFQHGALHGKFEGRALGAEKGFDLWAEVGYYEGMANTWNRLLSEGTPEGDRSRKHSKRDQQISSLLAMIQSFPKDNQGAAEQDADLMQLLQRIRARYKATAAALGFQASEPNGNGTVKLTSDTTPQLAELRGQLVDTSQLRY